MKHGVALIGCGVVGRKRARALPPEFQVLSLMDTDVKKAESLTLDVPNEVCIARTIEEAVSVQGVDVAIIATVHAWLVPSALTALAAGCHLLVEKPGARSSAELNFLREVASSQGRVVRIGFNHRFHPGVLKMKELIATRDYGPPVYIRGRYGHGGRLGYEKEWRADRELSGGGELLDQGIHLIDLAHFIVGDLDLVFAETRTDFWEMKVEDNAYLALRPRAGGFCWLHASWTEWKNIFSFEVALTGAKLSIAGLGGSYGTEQLICYEMKPDLGPPDSETWEWPGPDESWAGELKDFSDAISNNKRGIGADLGDTIHALQIVEEAYSLSENRLGTEQ